MPEFQLRHDVMQPFRRQGDAETFLMTWTGGVKMAKVDENRWRVLPVLHDGRPHVNGFYTRGELVNHLQGLGYRFVAFQQINWMKGAYFPHWAPAIPGERNFALSPSDLWGNVARHLGDARMRPHREEFNTMPEEEFVALLDAAGEAERLARLISLSLRNLDTSVEHVADFYHDELINQLADRNADGRRSGTTRDVFLYGHVHAFFLHLGAVRDYFAAFVADKLGMDCHKVDSMARLVDKIRAPHVEASPLLQIMKQLGCIVPEGDPSTKWRAAGWLETASDLRNEFVHRRAYGQSTVEQMGCIRPCDALTGLYRYYRPIALPSGEADLFDVVHQNYAAMIHLLHAAAKASGHNAAIPELDRNGVTSLKVTR